MTFLKLNVTKNNLKRPLVRLKVKKSKLIQYFLVRHNYQLLVKKFEHLFSQKMVSTFPLSTLDLLHFSRFFFPSLIHVFLLPFCSYPLSHCHTLFFFLAFFSIRKKKTEQEKLEGKSLMISFILSIFSVREWRKH